MNSPFIRMNRVTLTNIKNVGKGSVELNKVNPSSFGASIVGVYGQNGSGKTALVWAIEIIKDALSGESLPADTSFYIRQNSDFGSIEVEFLMTMDRDYSIFYRIDFCKVEDRTFIIHEGLDYSAKATSQLKAIKRSTILEIDCPAPTKNETDHFDSCLYKPEKRLSEWSTNDKQLRQNLLIAQVRARDNFRSFIFNEQVVGMFRSGKTSKLFSDIVNNLQFYGRMNLFVLNKNSDSSFSMDLLPLSMRIQSENSITKCDKIMIGLGRNVLSRSVFDGIQKVIEQIDLLIDKLVPGLHIEIVNLEKQLDKNGQEAVAFELVSNRNGVITPLRYESEGIKKILCILSSLIAMYNNESVFVAIDEMDSGVFEYLLGEILTVINETGKGQLLFTSHNMRPLEVLENNNIYFSTTNPDNKYIQFTGIKENNNLRNTFLRTIDLGGQKESIYESTSAYDIGKAFRKAGGAL